MLNGLIQLIHKHQVLFVGVGNVLKNDDGIGVQVCKELKKNKRIPCLIVEASIEKYIGKIEQLNPEILVIIDCMYFPGKEPGYYKFLPVESVTRFTLNTHNISLGSIADFFKMPVYILGIHPQNTAFGEKISSPVKTTAKKIVDEINRSL